MGLGAPHTGDMSPASPGLHEDAITRFRQPFSGKMRRFSGFPDLSHPMNGVEHESFLSIDGHRIWYGIAGEGAPGIPLLVLHGGPGVPHEYLLPLIGLASDRPVIFYDQLGCGNSEKPADTSRYTLEYFTRELAMVREELGLDEVHILGQSWGTMLGAEYLLNHHPAGVISLVLSAPCLSASRWDIDQRTYIMDLPNPVRDTILRHEKDHDYASPEYQDAMMTYYERHICRMDPWPDCLNASMEKFAHDIYELMWGPSEFTITGTLKDFDVTGSLGRITVPVLFTCGEFDEATPTSTRYYHEQVPGSELKIFAGASHSHHLEEEAAYLETVTSFLKRAGPTGR